MCISKDKLTFGSLPSLRSLRSLPSFLSPLDRSQPYRWAKPHRKPNPTARTVFRAPPYSQSRSLIGSYRGVWLSCPFFADHHEPSHKRQTPRHEPLSGRHPTPNIARPDPLGRPPWSRPRPHWPFPSALALAKAPLACPSGPCPVLALPRACPGPGLALPWPSPWTTYAHNMCPCQLTCRSSSLQSKYAHNMCPCQLFCTSSLLRR